MEVSGPTMLIQIQFLEADSLGKAKAHPRMLCEGAGERNARILKLHSWKPACAQLYLLNK